MPSWSVPPGLMVPGPRQPDADDRPSERGARPSQPGPQPSPAEPAADRSSSWPGVAPPAGWFLHSAQSLPADSGKPADDAPAEPELVPPGQRSAPRAPDPAAPEPGRTGVPRRAGAPRRTRALRRTRASRARQPLAERPRRALAHPRAGRILVLPADAEAVPPDPGPDPGALRPGGRPGLPAHPYRPARLPRRGYRGAGPFPVATLSPGLDRSRHRVGAAPRPAAALAPDRLALCRTRGGTPGRMPAGARQVSPARPPAPPRPHAPAATQPPRNAGARAMARAAPPRNGASSAHAGVRAAAGAHAVAGLLRRGRAGPAARPAALRSHSARRCTPNPASTRTTTPPAMTTGATTAGATTCRPSGSARPA